MHRISSEHHLQLLRLIEGAVLPRLTRSLVARSRRPGESRKFVPDSDEEIGRLVDMLSCGDRRAIEAWVARVAEAGVPAGSIFLHVFAPAARQLCERWERRRCSFHEVSTGLIELLALLRRFGTARH
jgi:hypothetical protein